MLYICPEHIWRQTSDMSACVSCLESAKVLQPPPSRKMTFESFVRQQELERSQPGAQRTYLQTVLGAHVDHPTPHFSMCPIGGMITDIEQGLNQALLHKISTSAHLGSCTRAQLFVSPVDALSQLHYDQYDNLFYQATTPCMLQCS